MIRRKLALFFFLLIYGLSILSAVETRDRFVRLIINEKTGNFSLFFLSNSPEMSYEPLFSHKDPSTSY